MGPRRAFYARNAPKKREKPDYFQLQKVPKGICTVKSKPIMVKLEVSMKLMSILELG